MQLQRLFLSGSDASALARPSVVPFNSFTTAVPPEKNCFRPFSHALSDNRQWDPSSEHYAAPLLIFPRRKRLLPARHSSITKADFLHLRQIWERSIFVDLLNTLLLLIDLFFPRKFQSLKLQKQNAHLSQVSEQEFELSTTNHSKAFIIFWSSNASAPVGTTAAPYESFEKSRKEKNVKSGATRPTGTSFRYLSTSLRFKPPHKVHNWNGSQNGSSRQFLRFKRRIFQNTDAGAREKDVETSSVPERTKDQTQVHTDGDQCINLTSSVRNPPGIIVQQQALGPAKGLKILFSTKWN